MNWENIDKNSRRQTISHSRKARMRRQRRKRVLVLTGMTLGMIGIVAGIIAGGICLYKNLILHKINLKDCTSLSYTGYDTDANLTATLEGEDAYADFFQTVTVNVSPQKNLSNGDEVTLSYAYDKALAKEMKIWVQGDESTIEMSGLKEAQVITYEELFQNILVSQEGISPKIKVTLETPQQNGILKNVTYQLKDGREYYADGEVAVIEAIFDEEKVKEAGYQIEKGPDGYQKKVDIHSDEAYLMDGTVLSNEQLQELDQHARSLFTDANEFGLRIFCDAHLVPTYVNGRTTFEWTTPQLISVYFNVLTDMDKLSEIGVHINDVKLVYQTGVRQSDGVSSEAEAVVMYNDLVLNPDGTIELNLDSGRIISATASDRKIKTMLNNQEDEAYTSTKLEYH